jgi:hypothetical protein
MEDLSARRLASMRANQPGRAMLEVTRREADEQYRQRYARVWGQVVPRVEEAVKQGRMAEARRIVARWPMVDRRGGVDDGGEASAQHLGLRHHHAARQAVRRLLLAAAFGSDGGPRVHRPLEGPAFTPLPQPGDRRAQLLRLLGTPPLWWQGRVQQPGHERAGQVAVYLDVSGSMEAWLPVLPDDVRSDTAQARLRERLESARQRLVGSHLESLQRSIGFFLQQIQTQN